MSMEQTTVFSRAPSPQAGRGRIDFFLGLVIGWTLCAVLATAVYAQSVAAVPALTARVMDHTGTLDAVQLGALQAKLEGFEKRKGTQIVVLMVQSTQPEDIASYSHRVASNWKIGRKDVGDGLVLVVAKADRRLRIEVAKTLEGAVPDLAAHQIIEQAITPLFRKGDFAGGLNAGVDHLIRLVDGEPLPLAADDGAAAGSEVGTYWFELLFLLLFFIIPLVASRLRRLGWIGTAIAGGGGAALTWLLTESYLVAAFAGGLLTAIQLLLSRFGKAGEAAAASADSSGAPTVTSSRSWAGSSPSSSSRGSGGGFSSGGGGNFGGGGSSGKW